MKMILLPYRASMLIIGFAMLVAGLNIRDDILVECGISKEKDATFQKCLADYLDQLQEALVNRENPLIIQLFRKSIKCFPEEKTEEKRCYLKAMKEKFLQIKRKEHGEFCHRAAHVYYDYLRDTEILLESCIMDKNTSTLIFACLHGFNPEAQRIIKSEKNNGLQAFERMIVLISHAEICYNFTYQQGHCFFEQIEILKKNITDHMHKRGKEMVEKLTKCGFSMETIDTVLACTQPKSDEYIKLSFEIFYKPEHAQQMWNLHEAMKTCITKYTEIKKCLMPRSYHCPE